MFVTLCCWISKKLFVVLFVLLFGINMLKEYRNRIDC